MNPERPWPQIDMLERLCREQGLELRERLTVHPEYTRGPWIDPRVRPHVDALAAREGLAADVVPVGRPWQEPDPQWTGSGRVDLHAAIDVDGRHADRRSDFDDVFGSWCELREQVRSTPHLAGQWIGSSDVAGALSRAETDPAGLDLDSALVLMSAEEGPPLEAVLALADELRREAVGDDVTYVVNRNINFTNVCYTGCRFCAFAQRGSDADAYTLSIDQVAARAREAAEVGATEVCMQGGIHPDLPPDAYFDLASAVKGVAPDLHVHAYSPMEVMNGVARTGLSVRDFLSRAKESGVDSLPGTAAEILDDDVRWILTKGKLPTAQWVEVVSTAHDLGLPTTATMMYGHVDHPRHWVSHLRTIADIQRRTGGFTEFVPLPFVHQSSPIYLAGVARPGPTPRDNLAVHALARIMLHGLVDNIQCSWVKLGPDQVDRVLRGGVNDLGGTLMEETISRMAGSTNGSARTIQELEQVAARAGRPAVQRTTLYGRVPTR